MVAAAMAAEATAAVRAVGPVEARGTAGGPADSVARAGAAMVVVARAAGERAPLPVPRAAMRAEVAEARAEGETTAVGPASGTNPAADHGAQRVPDRVEDPLCKVLGRVGPQLGTPLRPMQAHGEPPCQVAAPIVEGHAHERNEGGARERRPEEQKIWHRRLPREARAL